MILTSLSLTQLILLSRRSLAFSVTAIYPRYRTSRFLSTMSKFISTPTPDTDQFYPYNDPPIGTPLPIVSDNASLTTNFTYRRARQAAYPENATIPKLFQPITLRGMTFKNRIWVVSLLRPLTLYLSDSIVSPCPSVSHVHVQLRQRPCNGLSLRSHRRIRDAWCRCSLHGSDCSASRGTYIARRRGMAFFTLFRPRLSHSSLQLRACGPLLKLLLSNAS